MSQPDTIKFKSVAEKMLAETAKIRWHELQRFFAQGAILVLDDDLDLVAVATMLAEDRTEKIEPLLRNLKLRQPSNDEARNWHASDVTLWSVVVAPYVLVQNKE